MSKPDRSFDVAYPVQARVRLGCVEVSAQHQRLATIAGRTFFFARAEFAAAAGVDPMDVKLACGERMVAT